MDKSSITYFFIQRKSDDLGLFQKFQQKLAGYPNDFEALGGENVHDRLVIVL